MKEELCVSLFCSHKESSKLGFFLVHGTSFFLQACLEEWKVEQG